MTTAAPLALSLVGRKTYRDGRLTTVKRLGRGESGDFSKTSGAGSAPCQSGISGTAAADRKWQAARSRRVGDESVFMGI